MNIQKNNTPWIIRPGNQSDSPVKLFCIPYAGGGASIFRKWTSLKNRDLFDIHIVQMPGREQKIGQQGYKKMELLIQAMLPEIATQLNGPFAFYGHSMGALIAYELIKLLEISFPHLPGYLFVGGRQSPDFEENNTPVHHLPEQEFIQIINERYKGIPDQILQNKDLLELIIPPLRDDIELIHNYPPAQVYQLRSPITAFSGKHDFGISLQDIIGWNQFTKSPFKFHLIDGGHFFMNDSTHDLLHQMEQDWDNIYGAL